MPILKYDSEVEIEETTDPWLKAGDIVLVRGNGLGSLLIRVFTRHIGEPRTKVNHVALVTRAGFIFRDHNFEAEITEASSRVRTLPISVAYGPPRRDMIAVYRPTNLPLELIDVITAAALEHVGQRYGYRRIAAHALDRLCLGAYFFRWLIPDNKYPICSWLVAHAYGHAGLGFGVPVGTATPDDIWDFVEQVNGPYDCIWPLGRMH